MAVDEAVGCTSSTPTQLAILARVRWHAVGLTTAIRLIFVRHLIGEEIQGSLMLTLGLEATLEGRCSHRRSTLFRCDLLQNYRAHIEVFLIPFSSHLEGFISLPISPLRCFSNPTQVGRACGAHDEPVQGKQWPTTLSRTRWPVILNCTCFKGSNSNVAVLESTRRVCIASPAS